MHPVYCSTIPSTRDMRYQTIPRTNRIWHFCQACWFKLPYQLEIQERSVSVSPYTHLMCVKISSTNITWHLPPSSHCILNRKQGQKWNCLHWTYKWFGTAVPRVYTWKSKYSIESQNVWGWKDPSKVVQSNPSTLNRDIFSYIWLLKAQSTLTLNVSRNGGFTTSLHNLCQCFSTFMVN